MEEEIGVTGPAKCIVLAAIFPSLLQRLKTNSFSYSWLAEMINLIFIDKVKCLDRRSNYSAEANCKIYLVNNSLYAV